MTKIVVTQELDFLPDQLERIKQLGDVEVHNDIPADAEEWLDRCKDADVICTGKFGLRNKWQELSDVFISVPFVGVGFIDPKTLKVNNVTLSTSPGCNRHAVSEWIICMMVLAVRRLDTYLNVENLPPKKFPPIERGLAFKKVTVLGKGEIGSRLGKVCEAMEMEVTYFRRGNNLHESVKDADVVVDTLSSNPSTQNLLDKSFFDSLKDGAVFISVTGSSIVDVEAMLQALDDGKLSVVVHDSGGIQVGDTSDEFYKRLQKHSKVLATPHISFNTDVTQRIRNDMMIDNIEAWINGNPQNVLNNPTAEVK